MIKINIYDFLPGKVKDARNTIHFLFALAGILDLYSYRDRCACRPAACAVLGCVFCDRILVGACLRVGDRLKRHHLYACAACRIRYSYFISCRHRHFNRLSVDCCYAFHCLKLELEVVALAVLCRSCQILLTEYCLSALILRINRDIFDFVAVLDLYS